jgi:hypothetical protein
MAVIHTAYAIMKISSPKGVITIKVDQLDALACENTSLVHAGHFIDKVAQDQASKAAKTATPLEKHWRPSLRLAGPHEHPWGL